MRCSATEAARIVAASGTAPKTWSDWVWSLETGVLETIEQAERRVGFRCVYDPATGEHYRVPVIR